MNQIQIIQTPRLRFEAWNVNLFGVCYLVLGACALCAVVVGERFDCDEAKGVTHGGAIGSENVGTSNRNAGEIPARRKNKVSFAMEISEGLVSPKPMAI